MGRRDFRRRESKKPKKDTKKISVTDILPASESVEVVKRGRKKREEE